MNINYNLTQNQYDFINAKEFFKLMIGGVGFGKSYAAAIDCFTYAMENPGAVIIYVAPTNDMLKNVNIKLFMELIPEELIFRYNAMSLEIEFINGTIILFRSAGDEARIQRLRGLSVAKIMIDEICSLNKSVWDSYVSPYLYFNANYKQIVLTKKDYFFTIEFAALDYTSPKQNQYKYMLEGLDEDWIDD